MKRVAKNKYLSSKLANIARHQEGTSVAVSVNPITEAIAERKRRKITLRPVRNKLLIEISRLCNLLKKFVPANQVKRSKDGIVVNGREVIILEGFASIENTVMFRFCDAYDLLMNLTKERVLIATVEEIKTIRKHYNN